MATVVRKDATHTQLPSAEVTIRLTLREKNDTQTGIFKDYTLSAKADNAELPQKWIAISASVKKTPPGGPRDSYTAVICGVRSDFPKDLSSLVFTVSEESGLPRLSITFDRPAKSEESL